MFGAGMATAAFLLWLVGYCPGVVVVGAFVGCGCGLLLGWVLDEVRRGREMRARLDVMKRAGESWQAVIRAANGR